MLSIRKKTQHANFQCKLLFQATKKTLTQQLSDYILSCCDYSHFYNESIMVQCVITFCLGVITVAFMMSVDYVSGCDYILSWYDYKLFS